MRATPLMLAIALGLGLPAGSPDAASPKNPDALRADALQTYIVVFDEAPAARFRGFGKADAGRPSLAATSPLATGARKYDATSAAAVEYVDYLDDLRRTRLNDAAIALMRPLEPTQVFRHGLNGMSVELTAAEAKRIAGLPGVRTVRPEFERYLMTDRGPAWIKADQVWSGAATGVANRGEGVIVGVIDSGINRTHVSFSGAGITNPLPGFVGYCASVPSACNSKLIGLWDFTGPANGIGDPIDDDGHGTHTASTAVGAPFTSVGVTYSGVAPRANLIAYKACPGDTCTGTAILASIDRAIADGVDVINYSIGSGPFDPWATVGDASADDAESFLAAREAGIVVAASAGNDGPDPGTHGNPANSPWVMGVAAATHDRSGAGDRLASFSGRGPVVPLGVNKPDITGPGVSIRAAGTASNTSVATLSGTSMSSPHVAGAAALLRSIHPSHTPDEVISALMLTARPSVTEFSLPTTPHDQGSGMVDVALAARAGLYLDVPPGGFNTPRANPYTGGAENINLPSIAHGACFRSCVLTRAFKLMPGVAPANYSVQASFTDAPGATITPSLGSFTSSAAGQSVSFTVNVDSPALVGKWVYGSVTLVNNAGDGRPNLRLPVSIYVSPFATSGAEAALTTITRNVTRERDYFDVTLSGLVPMPEARFSTSSLVAPVSTTQTIAADPTNDDPYDAGSNTYLRLVSVPATPFGSDPIQYRLTVTTSAANPDIDLFVGRDTDLNGAGRVAEELCTSLTSGSNESCVLSFTSQPSASQYWIVVQNFSGPGTGVRVDSVLLPISASSASAMVASGPGRTSASASFRIRVAYDDPSLVNGQSREGLLFIQPSPDATPIEVPIRISRSGSSFEPFALANNVGRAVTLPAGTSHDKLYFDVPPNVTSVEFTTSNASGNVDLYVAHVASPTGPAIASAPAWNGQAIYRVASGSGNESLTVAGGNLPPGRYYVVPTNGTGGTVSATVTARILTQGVKPAFLSGQYFNPARDGHGLFIDFAGPAGNPDQWISVWYAYLEDTTPTWYYSQGATPGADGIWKAELFRVVWDGDSTHAVDVGDVIVTPTGAETMTMSFNLDGRSGSEPMVRIGGGTCPQFNGQTLDVSGHWFSPTLSGFGYSYQVTGGANPQEVFIPYVYDGQGFPRWLYGQKNYDGSVGNFNLQWFAGFSPLSAPVQLAGTAAGTGTRTLATNDVTNMSVNANLTGALSGNWVQNLPVAQLSQRKNCQ
ncbi:S8 family peptidase [Arenimonas metalli]|nr:S8 family serine peptidase [Arenimonas metalli]